MKRGNDMWSPIRCAFLALPLLALAAACGGGGGGSTGGGGGITVTPPTPTPVPTATPAPTPTPALVGTMSVSTGGTFPAYTYATAPGGSSLVFSCGCSAQAGSGTLNADGSYTLPATSPATPPSPNPTYTMVPGRNYVIVATTPAKAESWDLQFAGSVPAHNVDLGTPSGHGDVFTAAGALYVFHNAVGAVTSDTAYDDWNLNAVLGWVNQLRTTPNAAETTLLNDIAAAQAAGRTLYPQAPGWSPAASRNATITNDLDAVKTSGDASLPTPCPLTGPGGAPSCAGAPSP